MTESYERSSTRVRWGRRKLAILALLFALPLAVAYVLYFVVPEWRPGATTNHGALVQPPRPLFHYPSRPVPVNLPRGDNQIPTPRPLLAHARLIHPGGAAASPALFRGKWTFVYFVKNRCGQFCRKRLYDTRQIRIATGKERHRIRRVLVAVSPSDWRGLQTKARAYDPHLTLVRATSRGVAPLLRFFSLATGEGVLKARRVYLLDPLGNWIMYYTPDDAAKGMLKDLNHLLRVSQID